MSISTLYIVTASITSAAIPFLAVILGALLFLVMVEPISAAIRGSSNPSASDNKYESSEAFSQTNRDDDTIPLTLDEEEKHSEGCNNDGYYSV